MASRVVVGGESSRVETDYWSESMSWDRSFFVSFLSGSEAVVGWCRVESSRDSWRFRLVSAFIIPKAELWWEFKARESLTYRTDECM